MVQEYRLQTKDLLGSSDIQMHLFNSESENPLKNQIAEPSVAIPAGVSYPQLWGDYVVNLSRVLCSFLFVTEDIRSQYVQISAGRTATPVSSLYGELSVKWVMRVLHTVFPCLKVCSNQNEFPIHLR